MRRQIGKKIRQIREARGLTLNELARRSGVAPANISRLENETQSIRVETLADLCETLGLTLSEFFGAPVERLPTGRRLPLLCLSQIPEWRQSGLVRETEPPMIDVHDQPGIKGCLALTITDVSMQGQGRDYFAPGDIVIIDPRLTPEPGDYVLAIHNEVALFRQYKLREDHIELAPLNNFWPTVRVSRENSGILGVTIEQHRRFRKGAEEPALARAALHKN